MAHQESSGFCSFCNTQVLIRRKSANHILHLLVTIVLGVVTIPFFCIGGIIWLLIWSVHPSGSVGGAAQGADRKLSNNL